MSTRRYSTSSQSSSSPSKSPLITRTPAKSRRPSSTSYSSSPYSSSYSASPPDKRRAKKAGSKKSPEGTKRAKEKGIERKLHSILLCKNEQHEAQLLTSFRSKRLIQYSRPIGHEPSECSTIAKKDSCREKKPIGKVAQVKSAVTTAKKNSCVEKKLPELQHFGCRVLRALENFVRLLHSKKYTLEGKLNIKMLYWIQSSKCLKLHKASIPDLKRYTKERVEMDYNSIGLSIRDDLFGAKGLNPPTDVLAWIELMLTEPLKNKYLLRCNVALLHKRAKMDLFLSYYEKLLQLKELSMKDQANKPEYDKVVKNIDVGGSNPKHVWWTSVSCNKYVDKVYKEKNRVKYNTVFEMLRFIRDAIYHLMDHSVEGSIVMFSGEDKYLMLETCFPGVFHKFQKAIVDAGLEEDEDGSLRNALNVKKVLSLEQCVRESCTSVWSGLSLQAVHAFAIFSPACSVEK